MSEKSAHAASLVSVVEVAHVCFLLFLDMARRDPRLPPRHGRAAAEEEAAVSLLVLLPSTTPCPESFSFVDKYHRFPQPSSSFLFCHHHQHSSCSNASLQPFAFFSPLRFFAYFSEQASNNFASQLHRLTPFLFTSLFSSTFQQLLHTCRLITSSFLHPSTTLSSTMACFSIATAGLLALSVLGTTVQAAPAVNDQSVCYVRHVCPS